MFIDVIFLNYKNIIRKFFSCIMVCSIMCNIFFMPANIDLRNNTAYDASIQNDIFSAVFVVEQTINEVVCVFTGNIFKQSSTNKQHENKNTERNFPQNINELSILPLFQNNKTLNLQLPLVILINKFLYQIVCFRECDVGLFKNFKCFMTYFLEMLLKSSFSNSDGSSVACYYKIFIENPV